MTKREELVASAISQLGQGNLAEYWSSALGKPQQSATKLAWCGIFVLSRLHDVGLGEHVLWVFGRGFLSRPDGKFLLPQTTAPQPGDIGYQDKPFQHHFLVESVDGDRVHSIDGNSGAYSSVNRGTHPIGHGCTYFSIAPLIELAEAVPLPRPSQPPKLSTPAQLQHAINSLMMTQTFQIQPTLLTVDGIVGPKTIAAIKWAQGIFHLQQSGDPTDPALLRALGLA